MNPGTFGDNIEFLRPELEQRGLCRRKVEKEVATAREILGRSRRLPEEHPGSKYACELLRDEPFPF